MSRTVVSLRLSDPELRFVDQLAAEKSITRSAALHQIFLQQVALQEIEKSIARLLDSRFAAMEKQVEESRMAARENLVAATNFLRDEISKQGGKK